MRALDYRDAAMNARHNPAGSSRYKGPRSALLVLTAGLIALPGTADAARVKGRFEGFRSLQNPVWAEAKDPKNHGYSFREPVPTVRSAPHGGERSACPCRQPLTGSRREADGSA